MSLRADAPWSHQTISEVATLPIILYLIALAHLSPSTHEVQICCGQLQTVSTTKCHSLALDSPGFKLIKTKQPDVYPMCVNVVLLARSKFVKCHNESFHLITWMKFAGFSGWKCSSNVNKIPSPVNAPAVFLWSAHRPMKLNCDLLCCCVYSQPTSHRIKKFLLFLVKHLENSECLWMQEIQ